MTTSETVVTLKPVPLQDPDSDTYVYQGEDLDSWIRENERLCAVVDKIDEHFVSTLKQHEQSFIKAYKGQMQKVHAELNYLKNKQSEQAGKLMKDDDITSLQTNIAWFKSEAIKLNKILEAQKTKMKSSQYRLKHDTKELSQLNESLK